ncbi:MAG: class I SAM-dependent methyltransferase [Candidatus Hydrogenedentes bacterium]|nr:class I SAM-dependent methyltransferase [Candidatus Hydrogenedentota bacterium]
MNHQTSLLDLACGHGRHGNALATDALRVVGVDRSAAFINLARDQVQSLGIDNAEYITADIHQIEFDAEFDRAILLNTVFGLASEEVDCQLFNRINRALKPAGLFCFDIINRDTIFVDFQPDHILERDGNFLLDRLTFDVETGRMTNERVYMRNGRTTHAPFSMRLYNYSEIKALLAGAGFRIARIFADWYATPMMWNSKKMVIIAEKSQDTQACSK